MRSHSRNQLLLITGTLLLTTIIYFAPREGSNSANASIETNKPMGFNFDDMVNKAKQSLSTEEVSSIQNLETIADKKPSRSVETDDSIAKIFDKENMPAIAAYYFEKVAVIEPTEKHWLNAAYRYFDGFKSATDSFAMKALVDKAILCYNKVLELNPKNLDAKTDLGVCYAEGTNNPMQGIGLLREVVAANPKHEMAQLNLGFLAVKSGQFDKAIARFDTVLKINPKNIEVYSYLGDVFLKKGDKEKAITNFEKYKSYLTDTIRISQVDSYIKEIKNFKEQVN
jgi:tetratricopeptide (TPR) repeat protein